jgi:hypothetical protein
MTDLNILIKIKNMTQSESYKNRANELIDIFLNKEHTHAFYTEVQNFIREHQKNEPYYILNDNFIIS